MRVSLNGGMLGLLLLHGAAYAAPDAHSILTSSDPVSYTHLTLPTIYSV